MTSRITTIFEKGVKAHTHIHDATSVLHELIMNLFFQRNDSSKKGADGGHIQTSHG